MDPEDIPVAPDPKKPWFEPVSALLMACATLGSAWCSYQSSEWGGISSGHASEADRIQRHMAELHLESNQFRAVHMEIFMEIMDAKFAGEDKLVKFYEDRFTGEIEAAYNGWLAQKPFENPDADPHPFVPHLYTPRHTEELNRARTEEHRHEEEGHTAGEISARYLSSTVLLASTLFFAGTSRNFDRRVVRQAMLFFAFAVFLYCLTRILTLPIA
jgi:hypothetical protein